jgi:hypothetical protein
MTSPVHDWNEEKLSMDRSQNDSSIEPNRRDAMRIGLGDNGAGASRAPIEANSNGITEGKSNGWRLIYCKGPEGEQLEFVQALGPVKQTFASAYEARRRARGG